MAEIEKQFGQIANLSEGLSSDFGRLLCHE